MVKLLEMSAKKEGFVDIDIFFAAFLLFCTAYANAPHKLRFVEAICHKPFQVVSLIALAISHRYCRHLATKIEFYETELRDLIAA